MISVHMQVNVWVSQRILCICICLCVCVCVCSLLWMSSLPVLKQRTQSAVPGMLPSLWAAETLWADAVGSCSSRTHKANLGTWSFCPDPLPPLLLLVPLHQTPLPVWGDSAFSLLLPATWIWELKRRKRRAGNWKRKRRWSLLRCW